MNQVSITADDVKKIQDIKFKIECELSERMHNIPPSVQVLIRLYGIVSGGISASLAHNEAPNDIDVYFTLDDARKEFERLIKEDSSVQSYISDVNPKYMDAVDTHIPGKLVTANAVTFKNGIQVITLGLSNIRETFDYVHTMPYYHCDSKKYYISPMQLDAIKKKKLITNPSPVAIKPTQRRKQKFLERGWTE